MKNMNLMLVLLYGVCAVLAGRRYLAIPIDGIDVIELNPIGAGPPSARIARQTEAYLPMAVPNIRVDELESPRQERSPHILDYVDFGAHTGANGAFGWYADYPAHH